MNIDLGSFAYGGIVLSGGNTPSWGTSLGQSQPDYKFTYPGADNLLIGMMYCAIPLQCVSLPLGKGGRIYTASETSECQLASLFKQVYINETRIDYPFLMVLIREESTSHTGRRTIKYSDKITYNDGSNQYNNQEFVKHARVKLGLAEDACWFVYSLEIKNQDELHMYAIVVDANNSVDYPDSQTRRKKWLDLLGDDVKIFHKTSDYVFDGDDPLQKIFNITPIVEKILSTGLIYSPTLIKRLAFSLMSKPFVILSGLAGSGKTQLALAFAKCLSENIKEQVCTVSIGADWTNREPLLGYPNALKSGEYVMPESGVLQLLMRANEDPSKPYFLILDEMNLSVVERYFADFLSAMESGEPIKLWDGNEEVPAEIKLPKNVFIIGTINVDETTYMFSPKVLDRANVIEFKIAPNEMEDYLGKKVNINLEQAYSNCADMAVDFVNKAKSQVEKDEKNKDVLLSFFKELKEVNAEFGYRTVNEISRYLHFSDGELSADSAIDTAILQKLLPKLHGSRKKLVPVLTSMWQLCLKDGIAKEIDAEFIKNDFKYPESAEKIQRMYNAVVDNGFTSFAEA